jgi:periplasmic divalent cation tolerance protein
MESLSVSSGNPIVVLVTAGSQEEAKRISDVLLERRLVACANVFGDVQSFFWWKGELDSAKEHLLVMKSRGELLEEIVRVVREVHTYETPEVVALPIVGGNPDYLAWIEESVAVHPRGESS